MRINWLKSASEPSLDEILSDLITQALMRSDGLDADQVRLVAIAARRKGGRRAAPSGGQVNAVSGPVMSEESFRQL
jgi:hypothetical protein